MDLLKYWHFVNLIFVLIYMKFSSCNGTAHCSKRENTFFEEAVIKPLPSSHVYTHFEFTTLWKSLNIEKAISNYKHYEFVHYDFFPRTLGEIIEKYHVREMHLSLTQGLWRYEKWGYPITEAPPGAQLWVWFTKDTEDVDEMWKALVNALSGLLCASLNFIDSTNTVSPEISFRPLGLADEGYSRNSSFMRYAALPRENVCTENLTPWKKLLPCDSKSGLATLLHAAPLYSAHYHSLSLHLRPTCEKSDCVNPALELVQSLSLVQKLNHEMEGRQDWSLKRLFSAALLSACPLASTSAIYVDMTDNEDSSKFTLHPSPSSVETFGAGSARRSYAFYDVRSILEYELLNLQARYPARHVFGVIPPPSLRVSRFVTGHGQERGSITVKIINSSPTPLTVIYLEVLPWYLRLFFHSSHSDTSDEELHVSKLITARDRERGWLYEAVVKVGPKSTTELKLDFTRALLKWLEYPPDANHGFYVPAAIFSTVLPTATNVSVNRIQATGLRDRLRLTDGATFIRVVSETLLVSLPTPDFSMPYNVICLACTVVALAFGPVHNITTKNLIMKKVEPKSFFGVKIFQDLKNKIFKRKAVDDSSKPTETKEKSEKCSSAS